MKNKKRAFIVTLCLMAALLLGACGASAADFAFDDYSFTLKEKPAPSVEVDEDMTIDGVLSESVWENTGNQTVFSSKSSDDIKMYTQAYLSSKGVYFGITVKDNAFYYNENKTVAYNTGAELYVAALGKSRMDLNLRLVPTGEDGEIFTEAWVEDPNKANSITRWYSTAYVAAATVQGVVNTSVCEGYTIEVFLAWAAFGTDPYTNYVQYMPAFNHVESDSASAAERTWTGYPGIDLYNAGTYLVVDNQGICDRNAVLDSTVEYDEGMTVDGNLSESVWASSTPVSFSRSGKDYGMTVKSYTTDKGLYIGVVQEDKYIYYADESVRPIGLNTGFEMLIAPNGLSTVSEDCLQIRMTANGVNTRYMGAPSLSYTWTKKYFPLASATTIQGTLNATDTAANTGFTTEMFIPWSAMNAGADNRDTFRIYPCLVHTEDAELADKIAPWAYTGIGATGAAGDPSTWLPMGETGYQYSKLILSDVALDGASLSGDYYAQDLSVSWVAKEITNSNMLTQPIQVTAQFNSLEKAEIKTENGVTTLRIHKDDINHFLTPRAITAVSADSNISAKVFYTPLVIDGTLNEPDWAPNTFVSKNTANNVTQETRIFIGEGGLGVGVEVADPNVVDGISRIEVHFYANGKLEVGNAWAFRFYSDGTHSTYIFRDPPTSDNYYWTKVDGADKLAAKVEIVKVTGGYHIEAFIPYSSLGLSEKPTSLNIVPAMILRTTSDTTIGRHGDINFNNASYGVASNYEPFDANGYAAPELLLDDITLYQSDLSEGYYEKEFSVYSSSTKLNKVTGVAFDDTNISEIGDGVYKLRVAAADINDYASTATVTATKGEISQIFAAFYSPLVIDGVIDEAYWAPNTFVSKNTANNVTQETHIYIGEGGLGVGIEVRDPNVVDGTSRIEFHFYANGNLAVGNAWAFRFYSDGTVRTYVFREPPEGQTFLWAEKSGTEKLAATTQIVAVTGGYHIEAFIPYSSLGLSEKPTSLNIIPTMLIKPVSGDAIGRHGDVNFNNASYGVASNYEPFDENGYAAPELLLDDITLYQNDLSEGYYEKQFSVYASSTKLNKVTGVTFDDANISEVGGGVYKIRVAAANINDYASAVTVTATKGEISKTFGAFYSPLVIDGVLDEAYWAPNTLISHNTANNVTQETHIFIGEGGLGFGVEVTDPNVTAGTSRIEIYFYANGSLALGNAWGFRFYSDGTVRTYIFRDPPASDGYCWTEKSGTAKLAATVEIVLTSDGYRIEAFIPYSSLGLSEKPTGINLVPLTVMQPVSGSVLGRYGDVNYTNASFGVASNYEPFDANGYVATALLANHLILSQNELSEGYYEKEFAVYASSTKLNKVTGVTFNDTNISEIGGGVYKIRVAAANIADYASEVTVTATKGTLSTTFNVTAFSDIIASAVRLSFTGGTVANSGTNSTVTTDTVVTDAMPNATAFVHSDGAVYVPGIEGDLNGAIAVNHRTGVYPLVKGYAFGMNDFTVSVWVYVPAGQTLSTGNSSYLFGTCKADSGEGGFRMTLRKTAAGYIVNYRGGGLGGTSTVAISTISHAKWSCYTVVREGVTLKYYVDGALIGTNTFAENYDFGTNDLAMGAYIGETWSYNSNTVHFDELNVFSSALTATQVAALSTEYGA